MSKKKKQNGDGVVVESLKNQVTGNSHNPSTSDETVVFSSPSVSCTLGEADSDMELHGKGNVVEQAVQEQQNQQNAGQVFDERPQRKTADGKKKSDAKPASEQQRTYRSLFPDNRDAPTKIKLEDFRKYKSADGKVKLGPDVVDDHELTVGHYLIGYVAGKFPGRGIIAKCCNSWKVPCSLKFHASEWLIFKFDKLEDRNKILEGGPYYIYGRPLLLKTMPDCFNFTDDEIGKVPVWVQFPNLPLQLWNAGALSMIASHFGKPLYTDGLTGTKGKIDYARVLIEVDVAVEPVESVTIELPNGSSFEQKAYYEFLPKFCKKCRAIGHLEDKCPYYKTGSVENSMPAKPGSEADVLHSKAQVQGNKTASNTEKGRMKSDAATATGVGDNSKSGAGKNDLKGQKLSAGTNVQQKSEIGGKPGAGTGEASKIHVLSGSQRNVQKSGCIEQEKESGNCKDLAGDKNSEQRTKAADEINAVQDVRLCRDLLMQNDEAAVSRVQTEAGNSCVAAAQSGRNAEKGTADQGALNSGEDVEAAAEKGQRQVQMVETAGNAKPQDAGHVTDADGTQNMASGIADSVAVDDAGFTVVKRKNKQSKSGKQHDLHTQEGIVQSAQQSKQKGSKVKEQKISKTDKGKGLAPTYAS